MILHHVTLNTGHTRASPRSEVSDEALAAIASMIHADGEVPGVPLWAPRIPDDVEATAEQRRALSGRGQYFLTPFHPPGGGALWSVVCVTDAPGDAPDDETSALIATFGVARHAIESALVWDDLLAIAADARVSIACPTPPTPWLGVLLHPYRDLRRASMVAMAADWLGDFERCVAWAWIDCAARG